MSADNPGMKMIITGKQHLLNADPDWPEGHRRYGPKGTRFQSTADPLLLLDLLREDVAKRAEGIATAPCQLFISLFFAHPISERMLMLTKSDNVGTIKARYRGNQRGELGGKKGGKKQLPG